MVVSDVWRSGFTSICPILLSTVPPPAIWQTRPRLGVSVDERRKKYEEGYCPECDSQRADVKARHVVEYHDRHFDAVAYYSVLECRGCGEVYFKSSSSNSESIDYHLDPVTGEHEGYYRKTVNYWPPAAKRRPPDWIDQLSHADRVLASLFSDVYTALNNDLAVLSAIGMRTVFDRASEIFRIDTNKPFKDKLDALVAGNHITEADRDILAVLIDAGSAAAHRGWSPKSHDLGNMMSILEAFLHRAFILEGLGVELGKIVPKRGEAAS